MLAGTEIEALRFSASRKASLGKTGKAFLLPLATHIRTSAPGSSRPCVARRLNELAVRMNHGSAQWTAKQDDFVESSKCFCYSLLRNEGSPHHSQSVFLDARPGGLLVRRPPATTKCCSIGEARGAALRSVRCALGFRL